MKNPEQSSESRQEDIGEITDSGIEGTPIGEQAKKLDALIANSFELKSRIETFNNPYPGETKDIIQMVDSWNAEHPGWTGELYIEKKFTRKDGRTLTVAMDRFGNIHLGGKFEPSN